MKVRLHPRLHIPFAMSHGAENAKKLLLNVVIYFEMTPAIHAIPWYTLTW